MAIVQLLHDGYGGVTQNGNSTYFLESDTTLRLNSSYNLGRSIGEIQFNHSPPVLLEFPVVTRATLSLTVAENYVQQAEGLAQISFYFLNGLDYNYATNWTDLYALPFGYGVRWTLPESAQAGDVLEFDLTQAFQQVIDRMDSGPVGTTILLFDQSVSPPTTDENGNPIPPSGIDPANNIVFAASEHTTYSGPQFDLELDYNAFEFPEGTVVVSPTREGWGGYYTKETTPGNFNRPLVWDEASDHLTLNHADRTNSLRNAYYGSDQSIIQLEFAVNLPQGCYIEVARIQMVRSAEPIGSTLGPNTLSAALWAVHNTSNPTFNTDPTTLVSNWTTENQNNQVQGLGYPYGGQTFAAFFHEGNTIPHNGADFRSVLQDLVNRATAPITKIVLQIVAIDNQPANDGDHSELNAFTAEHQFASSRHSTYAGPTLYYATSFDGPAVTNIVATGGLKGAGTALNNNPPGPAGVLAGTTFESTLIIANSVTAAGVKGGGVAPNLVQMNVEGGAALAGAAIEDANTKAVDGGATLGGLVVPYGITNITPRGGAVGTRGAIIRFIRNLSYEAGGTVLVQGSSFLSDKQYLYNATGSVQVSSSASQGNSEFTFFKDLGFSWDANSRIRRDFNFGWNSGRLQRSWYRVVGKGTRRPDCFGDDCCQKIILNVHARTPAELCEKLSRRKLKMQIESIDRFTLPAEGSNVVSTSTGVDENCNPFVRVEVCQIPACAAFCVDTDITEVGGFSMFVQVDAFKEVIATGQAFLSGTSPASYVQFLPEFSVESSGELSVSGEAVADVNHVTMRGGARMGGSASFEFSRWAYEAGRWPDFTATRFGSESESLSTSLNDQIWSLSERVFKDDSLTASSDISFGKKTQRLVVKGFGLDVPDDAKILRLNVRIDRYATKTGVKDLEVLLVAGNEIVSNNLADTVNDWPLLESTKTYGAGSAGIEPWRDGLISLDYGPLTAAQVNSPDFGVALKARASSSINATIVRLDYISVEVIYESVSGSLIRISGESTFKSPSYHTDGLGSLAARSSANTRVGKRYRSNGLGSDGQPEIRLGGRMNLSFDEPPMGGLGAGGEALVTPFVEIASGGMGSGGEAIITPFIEYPTGGTVSGGKVQTSQNKQFAATGNVAIIGDAFTPEASEFYTAAGSVSLTGVARVRYPNWSFNTDGTVVILTGSADQRASTIGTPVQTMEFDMVVLQSTATFLLDVHKGDASPVSGGVNKCGCLEVPLAIELSQNFARNNVFSKFLVRNNFTIAQRIRLRYNEPNGSWQANLHYRGFSSDTNETERWDIMFELQCTDIVGSIPIGENIWKLAMQVFRRNLATGEDFESRVVVGILPDNTCGVNANQLTFEVNYDTQLDLASVSPAATVYQSTLFDNIGLFKNPAWQLSPDLILRISQAGLAASQRRVDLTSSVLS